MQRRHRGPDELQVVGKADRAAGDRQRRDENRLEDEQEAHQPAEAERLERLAQVQVAPAAAGQRGAELRVDEAVGQREHEAGDPRVEDVRPVHRRDHERNGQERPDADHADDVGGRRLQQAHRAARGSGRSACAGVGHDGRSVDQTRGKLARADERIERQRVHDPALPVSAARDRRALVCLDPRDQITRVIGHRRAPTAPAGRRASTRRELRRRRRAEKWEGAVDS